MLFVPEAGLSDISNIEDRMKKLVIDQFKTSSPIFNDSIGKILSKLSLNTSNQPHLLDRFVSANFKIS